MDQYTFFNPHPSMCLLILERQEGGERETERETERERQRDRQRERQREREREREIALERALVIASLPNPSFYLMKEALAQGHTANQG